MIEPRDNRVASPVDDRPIIAAAALHDVEFGYGRSHAVVRGLHLDFRCAEVTMIVGASGGGKTTVLKLLLGLVSAQRGSVEVLGERLGRASRTKRLDPRVAYIPQQLGLVRSRTVLENVLVGALHRTGSARSLFGQFPRETVSRARAVLATMGIAEKAARRVDSLSGGERQRVAIARALLQAPEILLADEFVSQLDPGTTDLVMAQVVALARTGTAVIMTTHELDVVQRYADRVIVLRDGVVALDSAVAETGRDAIARALVV